MVRNECFLFLRQDLEPECKSLTAACKEHLVVWVKRFQELKENHSTTLKASHLSTVRVHFIIMLWTKKSRGNGAEGADVPNTRRTKTNVNVSEAEQNTAAVELTLAVVVGKRGEGCKPTLHALRKILRSESWREPDCSDGGGGTGGGDGRGGRCWSCWRWWGWRGPILQPATTTDMTLPHQLSPCSSILVPFKTSIYVWQKTPALSCMVDLKHLAQTLAVFLL